LKVVPSFVRDMSSLEGLYLDNNKITDLRLSGFCGASNIKTMELDRNKITRLRYGVFTGLKRLAKLILTENLISSIQVGTFDELTGLKVLNLYKNSLAEVFKLTFNLPTLCQLTLSHNGLVKVEKGSFAKPPSTCTGPLTPFIKGVGMLDENPLRCPGLDEATGKYKATECTCINETETVHCNADFMACDEACGEDRRFVPPSGYEDDDASAANPNAASSTSIDGSDDDAQPHTRSGLVPGLVVPGVMIVLGIFAYFYMKSTPKKPRSNSISSSGTSQDDLDYALATGDRGTSRQNQFSTRNVLVEADLPVGAGLWPGAGPNYGVRNGALPPVSGSASRLPPMRGSAERLPDLSLPQPAFSRSPPPNPFAAHERRVGSGGGMGASNYNGKGRPSPQRHGGSPTRSSSSSSSSSRIEPLLDGSNSGSQRLLGPASFSDDRVASPVRKDYPRQSSGGRLPGIGGGLPPLQGGLGSLPPIGRLSRKQAMVQNMDSEA